MDTFDYIVLGLGIALITVGLLLFILGKRDSQKHDQLEGFGIKLNVSNPSIILIVFGIGLVLFPRLMPNNSLISTKKPEVKVFADDSDRTEPKKIIPEVRPVDTKPPPSNAFLPQGTWFLSQYEENGVDLTGNVQGNIRFNQRNGDTQDWHVEMSAVDGWGNVMNYYYTGIINVVAGGYNIDTQTSNDPNFMRQNPSRLLMHLDNPNSLHMEYSFNGSAILIHWANY